MVHEQPLITAEGLQHQRSRRSLRDVEIMQQSIRDVVDPAERDSNRSAIHTRKVDLSLTHTCTLTSGIVLLLSGETSEFQFALMTSVETMLFTCLLTLWTVTLLTSADELRKAS